MEARQAMSLVHQMTERFLAELHLLAATPVTVQDWNRLLSQMVPVDPGQGTSTRARRAAERKRSLLNHLYRDDHWAAPWNGTALGVLQAFNTYEHHHAVVRGTPRAERTMLKAIKGN